MTILVCREKNDEILNFIEKFPITAPERCFGEEGQKAEYSGIQPTLKILCAQTYMEMLVIIAALYIIQDGNLNCIILLLVTTTDHL